MLDANRPQQFVVREKKRDLQSPKIVLLTTSVNVRGLSQGEIPTEDETWQAQNRRIDVARARPEMGDGSPSQDAST